MIRIRIRSGIIVVMIALSAAAESSHAQLRVQGLYDPGVAVPRYDSYSEVFREHIEVVLPPSYLRVRRPSPPVRGFYAWKFSFGRTPVATFVFRTDSAVAVSNDRAVIRASALYMCQSSDQWVLECTIPVRANARLGNDGIIVDITDPDVVSKIRKAKPGILLRQLFEPGGRFRVDETGLKYDGKIAGGT